MKKPLIAAATLPVALAILALTQGGGSPGQVHEGPPPESLRFMPLHATDFNNQYDISYSYSSLLKEVYINWHGGPVGVNTPESTSYYPTALKPILRDGSTMFLVGGKRPTGGNTVIELWALNPPTHTQNPARDIQYLSGGGVRAKAVIYDAGIAGRDMVSGIWRDAVDDDIAFCQFWDSSDIYQIDLSTNLLQLVASATDASAPLLVAELTMSEQAPAWTRNHATYGSIQVLECNSSPKTWIVLCDADRDGMPESHLVANESTWDTLGLGSATNYLD